MKKRIWFEVSYSDWNNNESWKLKTVKTLLIPLPNLSKDLSKTDFNSIVGDILKEDSKK